MSYISLKEFRNLTFKTNTFYYHQSIVIIIISHQLAGRMRSMGKGWVQFCLMDYAWIYWTPLVI